LIQQLEREAALRSTEFIDCDSEIVSAQAMHIARAASEPRARAVCLYHAVRDGIFYEVNGALLSRSGLRASATLERRTGFCIHKCIAFVALARALGLPGRLGFSDVRNHLSTPRLRRLVGGDVFSYHAHAEIYLDERWIKVTPVFNLNLCRLFAVRPLDFDGEHEATLQSFDERSGLRLETVRDHGVFDDFPYERCMVALRAAHPLLLGSAVAPAREEER
jgi:transglutaminase-like putative cysteine protease